MGKRKRTLQLSSSEKNWMSYYHSAPAIIEKIESFGKSYNQLSLETVRTFLTDSKKSKFKI